MLKDKEHFAPFDLSALEEGMMDTDKDDDNDEEADRSKSIIFDDFVLGEFALETKIFAPALEKMR